MNDFEVLKNMFERAEIEFSEVLFFDEKKPGVFGELTVQGVLEGHSAVFEFNAAGMLVCVGAYS